MRSFQPQTLIRSTACQVAGIFWVWCGAKLGLLLLTHFRPTETLPPSRSCSSMPRRERDSAAPDSEQALANHFPPPSAPAEKSILPATSRNGQTDVTQISPSLHRHTQSHTCTHPDALLDTEISFDFSLGKDIFCWHCSPYCIDLPPKERPIV